MPRQWQRKRAISNPTKNVEWNGYIEMFKQLSGCIDREPVNKARQRELDIAKGFIIILMSLSHAIEILGWFFAPEGADGFFWYGFDMLIKGTAPVFIFCMGISLCYSRKQSASDIFRRALNMAGLVVLLETFRTLIPCFLEWLIFRDLDSIEYAYQFLCVDILQFATMALLAIALLKKLKLRPVVMLAVAVVCSVVGQILNGLSTGSMIGDFAVGYIWHSHDTAYFPFLNWFIVLLMGYSLGYMWLRLKDKDRFFKLVTPISLVIGVAYYASMVLIGKWYYFSGEDYCGIGILDVIFMIAIFFATVGISYYCGKRMPRVSRIFESMGNRVTSIYCIHWTIYAFLYLALVCLMGENYLPIWTVPPIGIAVVIIADLISRFYKKHLLK